MKLRDCNFAGFLKGCSIWQIELIDMTIAETLLLSQLLFITSKWHLWIDLKIAVSRQLITLIYLEIFLWYHGDERVP